MHEIFSNIYDTLINFIDSMGLFSPLFSCLFIILESIIAILPLFVFITINFIAFGKFFGFIISWICTVIGCILSYFLVKKIFHNYIEKKYSKNAMFKKSCDYINKLSVQKITVILAFPFTPAFMMNIAAGLSNMPFKKFLTAILISKIFLVYFWGMVGTGLVESFKNPSSLITVVIMVLIAYILSYIVNRIFKLN